jgi:hypothetical protein
MKNTKFRGIVWQTFKTSAQANIENDLPKKTLYFKVGIIVSSDDSFQDRAQNIK